MGRAQRKRAAPQAQAAPPPKASAAKRKKAQKLRQKADALEKRAALYAALADNGASGDDLRVVRAAVAGALDSSCEGTVNIGFQAQTNRCNKPNYSSALRYASQ